MVFLCVCGVPVCGVVCMGVYIYIYVCVSTYTGQDLAQCTFIIIVIRSPHIMLLAFPFSANTSCTDCTINEALVDNTATLGPWVT